MDHTGGPLPVDAHAEQVSFDLVFGVTNPATLEHDPVDVTGYAWAGQVHGVALSVAVLDGPAGLVRVTVPAPVMSKPVVKGRWWLAWTPPGQPQRTILADEWTWRSR